MLAIQVGGKWNSFMPWIRLGAVYDLSKRKENQNTASGLMVTKVKLLKCRLFEWLQYHISSKKNFEITIRRVWKKCMKRNYKSKMIFWLICGILYVRLRLNRRPIFNSYTIDMIDPDVMNRATYAFEDAELPTEEKFQEGIQIVRNMKFRMPSRQNI